jgi:two-component system, chemotaxis family, chemotaxis protein CheY
MASILLVDDDPDVLTTLQETLSSVGHEVGVASNGKSGLEAIRERPVDLVITDIFMPEKGGLDLIADVQRECPGTKIFAISPESPQRGIDVLRVARMLGAQRSFEKPLNLSTVLDAVQEEIEAKDSR